MTPARSGSLSPRGSVVLLLITVCLVGANMRITVYSVGPLLELIATDESVAVASLGGLVSVPLFAWGIVSAVTHALSARFGDYRTVLWSLVALAIGTVCRSWPGDLANLWVGTVLIGASLAIGNVLIPALIRRDFSTKVPQVMGLYTGLMASVGAVSAGAMVPLAELELGADPLGWRFALLLTGLPILPAVAFWIFSYRVPRSRRVKLRHRAHREEDAPRPQELEIRSASGWIWRDRLAWLVGVYMGAQSASFYILSTWIPLISVSHGRPLVVAGFDVMTFQLASILGSFTMPLLYRGRLRRWLPALLPVFMLATTLMFIFVAEWVPLATLMGGFLAGVSLSVSLTLPLVRTRSVTEASALSGMAQAVGYSLAAVGPITFGTLHDLSGGWLLAASLLVVVGIVQFTCGVIVGDDKRYVGS